MGWEEMYGLARGREEDRVSISSPVTVVDGKGGCAPPCGPTINLQEYTDYVLRKFTQQTDQGFGNADPGPFRDMNWSVTNANTDQPTKAIGFVQADSMFDLRVGIICRVVDSGATTLTVTVQWFDPLSGVQTTVLTLPLTATGHAETDTFPVYLLAGSALTVSVALTGAYGAAKYDVFVGASRVG